jgi:hypothetical protein
MTQTEIAQVALSGAFQRRIEYLMVKAAVAKLNAQTPPASDILLGQRILDGEERVQAWALAALTNPSIAAGAHDSDGTSILDADLEFAVNSTWAAFAL